MILQPEHTHSHSPQQTIRSLPKSDAPQILRIKEILSQMLGASEERIPQKTANEVNSMRKFRQQKVYLSYSSSTNDYLSLLLNQKPVQMKDHVSLLISERQNHITNAIDNDQYDLKVIPPNNLKNIKSELLEKISEIKSGMENLSQIEEREKKQEQLYQNYMEFRKRGYWNQKNQKSEQVKQFLKKMNRVKYHIRKKYQVDLKKREQNDKKQLQASRQLQKKEHKQYMAKSLDKQLKNHQERQKMYANNRNRKQEIKKFLSQYKTDKPLFIANQQKFQQYTQSVEADRRKKLMDIRKNHRPIEPEQIEQHQRKYDEFKQKLLQVQKKRQQEQQLFEKNQSQLRQLFHGHYHEYVENQIRNRFHVRSQKKKYRQKINEYKDNINDNFKPSVDPKKRKELQDSIRDLQLKQDKSKRKKIKSDGTVVYQQKSIYSSYNIGKSYLSLLRKYNEGKPRKNPEDRSASMMELNKKPKLDYLRQNRDKRQKATLSGWKKVLDSDGLTPKDKYDSVMGKVNIMEQQARQKQLQLRNMQNKDKALEIKEQLDKYYLESVAAKMIVLKDVILKE